MLDADFTTHQKQINVREMRRGEKWENEKEGESREGGGEGGREGMEYGKEEWRRGWEKGYGRKMKRAEKRESKDGEMEGRGCRGGPGRDEKRGREIRVYSMQISCKWL